MKKLELEHLTIPFVGSWWGGTQTMATQTGAKEVHTPNSSSSSSSSQVEVEEP